MIKVAFVLILSLFLIRYAFAQKRDTSVYYLNNAGKVVSNKDSADFFLLILPPDSSVNKNLFMVKEYYPDGKIRLVGGSKGNTLNNLKFQGPYVVFFKNGHRMMMRNYDNGVPSGDEIEYYPDGKLYNIRTYTAGGGVFLKQCNDSTGNVLAANGKGKWIEYNDNFSRVNAWGQIENGVEDGTWNGWINDSVAVVREFNEGEMLSTSRKYKYKYRRGDSLGQGDAAPEFPGGFAAFSDFLRRDIRYPAIARENNTQGKLIIAFVIEKNGSISNITVLKGIGDGCEEEAERVIELSPVWEPGIQNGKPVRAEYRISLTFAISGNECTITPALLSGDSPNIESALSGVKILSNTAPDNYQSNDNDTSRLKSFYPVETVPEFPGGVEALYKFIRKKIYYPEFAKKNHLEGKVLVSFVVEKDGTISNVKVLRGIDEECDAEAVRIIKMSPRWKPAMQNGKPVRVEYSVPVSFNPRN